MGEQPSVSEAQLGRRQSALEADVERREAALIERGKARFSSLEATLKLMQDQLTILLAKEPAKHVILERNRIFTKSGDAVKHKEETHYHGSAKEEPKP